MRRRGVKNLDKRLEESSNLIVKDPISLKGKWNTLFNNNNPIYLEIGMGKGDFIIEQAKRNPNINYIGLEKFPSVLIVAYDKLKDLGLTNLYLVVADATNLLDMFEENEVSKIYLNFSDPWPKKRHIKRRLTSNTFLPKYEVILNNSSTMEFKTDNQELFEYSIISFNEYKMKFIDISLDLHNRLDDKGNLLDIISTEYEKKFVSKGNKIYFIEVGFNHE